MGDIEVKAASGARCSTPFGITGWDGSRHSRGGSPVFPVLNAFRHHRVGRSPSKFSWGYGDLRGQNHAPLRRSRGGVRREGLGGVKEALAGL